MFCAQKCKIEFLHKRFDFLHKRGRKLANASFFHRESSHERELKFEDIFDEKLVLQDLR